jgi:hypothetical protein
MHVSFLFDLVFRTPDMSAMHQDESSDLQEVARILGNSLGVSIDMCHNRYTVHATH